MIPENIIEENQAVSRETLPLGGASCSPLGFRSCAEWPPGHIYFAERPNTTTDRHDTREQAEAVCEMLQARGLGGERIHFPVKTWIEEIFPENATVEGPAVAATPQTEKGN